MSDVPANDPAYQPIPGAAPEVDLGPEQPASGPTTVIHGDRNVTYTQPQVTTPHLQAADYPSNSGIYNKEDAARAAGYSWQDIDAHIGPAQVAAQDAGYTQDEINQYLGYASPDAMVSRNTDTWAQVQHYNPKTLQPASDGTFDLTANPNWKGDYAAALLRGEVKGPKDFADQYVVSAMRASGQPPTDPLLAAGAASADKLAAQLPGRRDLTDAALSLGGDFQNNQQNLLDHWDGTGENPLAAAIRAQTDPALRAGLIFDNTHTLPIFERHLQNIADAARQGVEDVYGSDLAGGAADWGADGKDPNIFHLLAYIAAKDVDALSRTVFQAPAIALARGGAQSLREMGMSEGGADDAMRDALALAQSIAGGDVRVGPAGELRASGGGFEPFPDRAFGPRPPGPVTDIGGEGMLAPPLRQLPAPLRALTEIPIDKIDLAKPTEEAVTQIPASEAFKPVEPAERVAPTETPPAEGAPVQEPVWAEDATPAGKLQALARDVLDQKADVLERMRLEREGLTPDEFSNPNLFRTLAEKEPETNTKANMADVLNEKADQLETMRLTREGHIPDEFSNPHFFENLAKNEDPETQELAKGYDTATALRNFFGQVIPDALKDITGAQPNPLLANAAPRFRYREQVAAGEDYVTRLMVGPTNVQTAHVGAILDKHILDFAPHMQEWNDSLDALEKGFPGMPPEDTVIGKFIGHMQGIPGFILNPNNKFSKIADELKNVNEFTHGWLQWAATNGMIDQPGYISNYFRQRWTKPNEADRIFGGGGRAGDTSGTKKRTIPNWFDGLRAGLIPRDRDPLKIVLQDVTGKLRLANHANMMQTMMNEGWVRTADKSQPGDIRLNYWGKELYAQPGLAKIYNRWANMRDLPPGLEKTADFLNQAKNTAVGSKLLFPIWHTLLVTKELLASGYARAWDELTHGEFERAASSIVSSTAVIPRFIEIARADKARMARYLDFGSLAPGQKSTDRVVQLIVNAGSQMGPRQAAYRAGYRQNLQGSIAAGRTFGQYVADLAQNKQVLGTLVNDIRESWKPAMTFDANGKSTMTPKTALAIPGLVLHELGTAVTSVGGPLFDQLIPMMRRAVIFENADALLRHNINASDEYLTKRLTQVVKNTDDRYGEMQQETLFWPRWARMIANGTMISTSFFYGTFRWALNSVGIKSISRRGGIHMEWNPIATKSLIALGLVTAISNTMYQKLKTGEWPQMLLDLEFPHPVAGQPGRVQGPGQDKEFVDWAKIAVNATSAGIDNGWGAALMATTTGLYSYATGKEYDVPDLLRTFETGENPIGLRPGYMPGFGGGLPGMILRQLAPMLLTNPDEISAALKLSWPEKLVLREAPKWAEDWNAWRGDATHGQIGLHREWTAQMIKRARQDAQRTGVPFDQ